MKKLILAIFLISMLYPQSSVSEHGTADNIANTIVRRDASGNFDGGTVELEAVNLDTTVNGAVRKGQIKWNTDDRTVDIGLGNGVVMQVGQELPFLVKNESGVQIDDGTLLMYAGSVGASGKMKVLPLVADGSVEGAYIIGAATQNIATNEWGYAVSMGRIRGIPTNGTAVGEVWSANNVLYPNPNYNGKFSNVQHEADSLKMPLGIVSVVHATNGEIIFRASAGSGLHDAHDAQFTSPTNGQFLRYNSSNRRWENVTVNTISTYGELTIADNSTAIVINTANQWQAVSTLMLEGLTYGFTYQAGTSGTDISAYADSSGTHTTVTTTGAHSLSLGDYITIDGTTNYNGIMKVTSSADNTHFVVEWVYVADDATGNYSRGVCLTADVGSAGNYQGQWNSGGQSADANQAFHFSPCKNTTVASKALAPRKFSNADDGSFSGGALMPIADGDKIFFIVKNLTSAGDLTLLTLNMNLVRL